MSDNLFSSPLPAATPRRIAALLYPDAQILDLTGPIEVFATASRRIAAARPAAARPATAPAYEVELLAAGREPVAASSGVALLPARTLDEAAAGSGAIDTLILPGGRGSRVAMADPHLIDWIRHMAPRVKRLASVCTGAFLLAETGLLDHRRAATHWASCDAFAGRYPAVRVEPDALFVRDGSFYTSAGITAGMDLALALVEEDFGRALALDVARWMVMFLKRPGGQSQFSSHLAAQESGEGAIGRVQGFIMDHLSGDLDVSALAAVAAMSPRHFARRFRRETGTTPAAFVERARVEAARRQLSETPSPLGRVAAACGFGDVERLRRAFQRCLGVNPHEYRARFSAAPAARLDREAVAAHHGA